jgi:hypothetical protein
MRVGLLFTALAAVLLPACSGARLQDGAAASGDVHRVGGDLPVAFADEPPAEAMPAVAEPPPIDPTAPVPTAPTTAPPVGPGGVVPGGTAPGVEPMPPPPTSPVICAPPPYVPCYVPCAPGPCAPVNPCCPPPCEPVRFCNPCDPCAPCSPGYVGFAAAFGPGIGGGLFVGVPFENSCVATWFVEASVTYHDLSAFAVDEGQGGKFVQALVGVKGRFLQDSCWHPIVRASVGWFNVTGDPDDVDIAEIPVVDDYLGGYVSMGLEYDVSRDFTTGPELGIFGGIGIDDGEWAFVPQFRWNFILNF